MPWLFFLFGLFLGSFLNTIALRLETKEKFIFARSHCPNCGKTLTWFELIPVFSFLWQKGRCLNCQAKISLRYPLVEISTGVWCAILAWSLGTEFKFFSLLEYLYYLVPISILFVLALYDWKTYFIDNRLLIFGALWFLFFYLIQIKKQILPERDFSYLANYFFYLPEKLMPFVSALVGFLLVLFIYLITLRKGIGFGDALVLAMLGLYFKLGDLLLILIFSSFWGSLYGLYARFTKNIRMLPFVPFIFLGVLTNFLFGQKLTSWYFRSFL